jgi:hypothetical protein
MRILSPLYIETQPEIILVVIGSPWEQNDLIFSQFSTNLELRPNFEP